MDFHLILKLQSVILKTEISFKHVLTHQTLDVSKTLHLKKINVNLFESKQHTIWKCIDTNSCVKSCH